MGCCTAGAEVAGRLILRLLLRLAPPTLARFILCYGFQARRPSPLKCLSRSYQHPAGPLCAQQEWEAHHRLVASVCQSQAEGQCVCTPSCPAREVAPTRLPLQSTEVVLLLTSLDGPPGAAAQLEIWCQGWRRAQPPALCWHCLASATLDSGAPRLGMPQSPLYFRGVGVSPRAPRSTFTMARPGASRRHTIWAPGPRPTLQLPSPAVCLEAASPPPLNRAGEAAHNVHLTGGNAPGSTPQITAGRRRLQFSRRARWPSSASRGRALQL
ncbi:hypothetical protein NDU88_001497 [Pleurodeles waltl]|uniref:Uncharacterized protein n=1 Tax=Pleurodeles waltl TaxID=8319 RepID=A0AAV7W0N4_PLEWA|nr:hypothetical protein NDU88_001497 [Pleurodeles waltl]